MKKATSILISVLMLIVMLQVSVATHYCHGNIAASKISFSGKHATCGMETDKPEDPIPGKQIKSLCCEDVILTYIIDDNYSPSSFSLGEVYPIITQTNSITAYSYVIPVSFPVKITLGVGPPYVLKSTNVDLADICVFRI